jgi:UDPglucose--hexose-1-phosphate uridylyltransferase
MSVIRRNPITGRWVIFSEEAAAPPLAEGRCPFCEGNEALTPPEIIAWDRSGRADGRTPNSPGWSVRVVPNAHPLLRIESRLQFYAEGMYDAASGTGAHEVIIETPEHKTSLTELPREQVVRVFDAYAQRISDLKGDPRFRSIFVFKNQGAEAGAGLPGHAHSQVIGLPVTPKALKEILVGARQHFRLKERCVFCDILQEEEDNGTRLVEVTEHFTSFAPYAARHPFEIWILPRRHGPDFEATTEEERADLAAMFLSSLKRLERVLPHPAYNMFLYSGPNRKTHPERWRTLGADFHWHIEILPRMFHEAGFEMGSGLYANAVTPEGAAEILRGSAGG